MSAPIIRDETDYIGFPGYNTDGIPDDPYYLNPISIVFHNTGDYYGMTSSKNTSTYREQYHNTNWSKSGATVAHYYVDGFCVMQMVKDNMSSWANGSADANQKYFSIEICDNWTSLRTPEPYFRLAEENAFWFAAKLVREHNLSISEILLHQDVFATDCPKRSKSVHGGANSTRDYIRGRVQYYYDNPNIEPNKDGQITPPPELENQVTWSEADVITSTSKPTGTEVRYCSLSGSYPSDPYTYGRSSCSLSSSKVYYNEMSKYKGYLVDSGDGIVWFKITNIKGTNGETIYLDLNEPGNHYYYYTGLDNATIVQLEDNEPGSGYISWSEADRITSTNNSTGTEIQYCSLSGTYPSDPYTYGRSSCSLSSSKVYYKEMNSYNGYLVDSSDGIVWFKVTSIKGTNGETIYLDLNEPGNNYFYYTATDEATILKK